jgi:hypothetical protein
MKKLLLLLTTVFFSLSTLDAAAAIPKAAENEAAQVTSGADAPKPKKDKARHANPSEKKPVKKTSKSNKPKAAPKR